MTHVPADGKSAVVSEGAAFLVALDGTRLPLGHSLAAASVAFERAAAGGRAHA